ncbi:MAG: SURF1 family protein [Marinosulfonomonas sp.]
MTRQMAGPLIVGIIGVAILLSLGKWQLDRLAWKQGILADITARIEQAPVDLPANPDPERDAYLSVVATGVIGTREIQVLASRKQKGAGYRVIAPFTVGDRTVLLDRGFIPLEAKDTPRGGDTVTVTGNLHWPDEVDSYTAEPDRTRNIWFARDVDAMAAELQTEPVLIIARSDTGNGTEPFPVAIAGIPNDHLQYAITWFSLALVWFGMTVFLLWRIKHRTS